MCFRFLYCPQLRIMSIHFLELENEQPQKEFINEYQNFIEVYHYLNKENPSFFIQNTTR